MTHRERFAALMDYEPVDRLPCYLFGYWDETLARWQSEGLPATTTAHAALGLDPDWEEGIWQHHGLVRPWPLADAPDTVVEETTDWRLIRTGTGDLIRKSKRGSSIDQHLEFGLQPTRESWRAYQRFFDRRRPDRWVDGWETRADDLNRRDRVACCFGASLYGWLRYWMGVENLSLLMYDDPVLLEEMLDFTTEHFLALYEPIVRRVQFDFLYVWEDCCGKTGPLFSPEIYRRHFHRYYRRIVETYRRWGVPHFLIDSDGWVDALVPCWVASGFDILFPIEPGTWGADPRALRRRYGKALRLMGGVDKHVIAKGEAAIRVELEKLRPLVVEGGYLPLPDHRIPPDCSWRDIQAYVRIYRDLFNLGGATPA